MKHIELKCGFICDLPDNVMDNMELVDTLAEEDEEKQKSYIALLKVTKNVLEACIDVLGFEAPERM